MNHIKKYDLQNLEFDASYFCDEVREGFFIPSIIKRYWACQLLVLKEIDRICRKHDIAWYAHCGTLLGAVRHGGYIPWDDDMDICMLRHDWIRFFEVAETELPKEYWIHNPLKEKDNDETIGKIRSAHAINFNEEHLKEYYGCPYSVTIDIFPLDDLSESEDDEEKRRKNVNNIWTAQKVVAAGGLDSEECRSLLSDIERENHVILHRKDDIRNELLSLLWKVFRMYDSDKAEYAAMMPFWIANRSHKYSKKLFKGTMLLPFENTFIPVPPQYEEVLHIEYGDYMAIRRDGGLHDYPVFINQEEILIKDKGENLFRYTINKKTELPVRSAETLSTQCREIIDMLINVHGQIKNLLNTGNVEIVCKLLEGCQNLAINLGTLLENRISGSEHTVHMLEEYCELVYKCSEDQTDENAERLEESLEHISEEVNELLQNRKKQILFLSFKGDWWRELKPFYEKCNSDPGMDVTVISVPYLIGDDVAQIKGEIHDDRELLPDNVIITDVKEYDFSNHFPDVIYTDYPYDGTCTTMNVPQFFYSENLRKYTEKLVYVPPFDCSEPAGEGDRANVTLKTLIEQPAVVYADEVILRSEVFKKLYVDVLTSLNGNREYWDEKIKAAEREAVPDESPISDHDTLPEEWGKKIAGRKALVFRISSSFILHYRNLAIKKIQEALNIISGSKEKIALIFSPDVQEDRLEVIDHEIFEQYEGLISDIKRTDEVIYDDSGMSDTYVSCFGAYYGCACNLAHKCRNAGIPVMIMNAEL